MWQAHAGIVRLAAELAHALAGQRASEAQLALACSRLDALDAEAEQLEGSAAAAGTAEATRREAEMEQALNEARKAELALNEARTAEQGLLALEEAMGRLSSQLEQVVKHSKSHKRLLTVRLTEECLTNQPVVVAGAARELATCCSNDTRRRCEAGG